MQNEAHPQLVGSVRALYVSPARPGCPIWILQLTAHRTLLVVVEPGVGGAGISHGLVGAGPDFMNRGRSTVEGEGGRGSKGGQVATIGRRNWGRNGAKI